MLSPSQIVERARSRCAQHLGPLGFCAICFRAEIEDAIAQEYLAMDHDEITVLIGRLDDRW